MYWDMLVLAHLVIGLIIGFILYEIARKRTIIVFCALGSLLPDIVDKPLGHLIFASSLDNGRIFFHSLGSVLLFIVMGLIVWNYYRSFSFLVVGIGMFLHQLADMMWKQPVNWYYPFLGPFRAETHSDYFLRAILAELTSVTEWVFFAAILVLGLVMYQNKALHDSLFDPDPLMQHKTRKFLGGLVGIALFVLVLSVIIIIMSEPFYIF